MEPLRGSTNQDFSTRQMVISLIAFFCPSIPQHLSCDHSSCDILFWHLVWVKHFSWPPRPRLPNPALIIVCFCTPTPQHLRDFCGFSTLQGDHNIQSKQRSTPQHLRPFCAFSTLQGILACAPSVTAIFNPNKDKPLNIWDIFARLKFKHTCNNWARHMNGPHSENMPLSAPLWIPFLHRSVSLNKPTQISCRQKNFITVQWFSWIFENHQYMFLDPFAQDRQVHLNHANAMAQHSWSFSWSEPSENARYICMCRFVYITSWPFTDAAFKSVNPNVLTPRVIFQSGPSENISPSETSWPQACRVNSLIV